MVNIKYSNAITEVLQYLKGIRKEDVDKIPKKIMTFFQNNQSKDYKCDFDYTKPLKELKLLDETKGIIGMICLNYWCETKEQKNNFISKMNENEIKYQKELIEKYKINNIFEDKNKNKEVKTKNNDTYMIEYKKGIFSKILEAIKKVLTK